MELKNIRGKLYICNKKIIRVLLILFSVILLYAVFYKKTAYFGFEQEENKSYISVKNNNSKDLSLKIQISISPDTPTFTYYISTKEEKEIIIDWDLIRKVDNWGEGNIYLYINDKENELDRIFLGEVELYEDGRNFINNLKREIVIGEY